MRRRFVPALAVALAAAPGARGQPILYVSSFNGPIVSRIPAPATVSTFGTGLNAARGLARDSAGNLIVGDSPSSLRIITSSGGAALPFASGFNGPQGVTIGPDMFVYVSNSLDNTVSRVSLSGGAATLFATGFDGPGGLRFGPDGNLYVANFLGNTVSRVGPGGGAASVFATGFIAPQDVAFDASGSLFATNRGGNSVSRVGPGGGPASIFASGFSVPYGLEFDPEGSGNLFVVNNSSNTVSIVSPLGGVTTYATNVPGAGYLAVQIPEPSAIWLCFSALASATLLKCLPGKASVLEVAT